MKQSFRSGFTLIELLVVIAIIAILAAILFPVFAQAREKARQTACLSNTKQLATAFTMYGQDYDETFPLRCPAPGFEQIWVTQPPDARPGNQQTRSAHWVTSTSPYLKNYQVWKCPSTQDTTFIDAPANRVFHWSYHFNTLLGAYPNAGMPAPSGVPLTWEGYGKAASRVFVLNNPFDIDDGARRPWPAIYRDPNADESCNSEFGIFGFDVDMRVHSGAGQNFAYADGHAKFVAMAGDYKGHPFAFFTDTTGQRFNYWTDGCSPWYFRPTRDDQ